MALMAFARHRPTSSIGSSLLGASLPSSWPLPVFHAHSIFPMGAVLTAALGQRGGKGRGRKAGDTTGAASQRANFRSYSAALLFLPWGPFCVWTDPPVGGWRGQCFACCPRSAPLPPQACWYMYVIDRARGGLAANWPARESAIWTWNHVRTAAADSLPAKGATANALKHLAAIRGSHAPPSQSLAQ